MHFYEEPNIYPGRWFEGGDTFVFCGQPHKVYLCLTNEDEVNLVLNIDEYVIFTKETPEIKMNNLTLNCSKEMMQQFNKNKEIESKYIEPQVLKILANKILSKNPRLFEDLEQKYFEKKYSYVLKACISAIKTNLKNCIKSNKITESDVTYAKEISTLVTEKSAKEKHAVNEKLKQQKKYKRQIKNMLK